MHLDSCFGGYIALQCKNFDPMCVNFSEARELFCSLVPQIQISAPALASASAIPSPIPELPPVIRTVFPVRSNAGYVIILSCLFFVGAVNWNVSSLIVLSIYMYLRCLGIHTAKNSKGMWFVSQHRSSDGQVTTEERGSLFLIAIDRPAKLNGFTPKMMIELA